jgi:hypothetical protein
MKTKPKHDRAIRDQVSARVDKDVLELIELRARAERRTRSNLIRIILTDWAVRESAVNQQAA